MAETSCTCGLRTCPNCDLHTMPEATDRCIPCGFGLVANPISPEQARAAYRLLSGKDPH
jgi:hypothetical protein